MLPDVDTEQGAVFRVDVLQHVLVQSRLERQKTCRSVVGQPAPPGALEGRSLCVEDFDEVIQSAPSLTYLRMEVA